MVFNSYIPQEQASSTLREKLTQLGFIPIDSWQEFEQYCRCDNPTCLDLVKTPDKHESKPHQERNLVTLFRNIHNRYIGSGESSGIRVSYVDLVFIGSDSIYREVLSEIPPLNLHD